MSTLTEALASRNRLSEYHIYHERSENVVITPFLNPKKEYGYKRKHKHDAEYYELEHHRSNESNSYFLHKPQLFFHDPPRTLRRGSHEKAPPICLIHCAAFWREWNIQFASNLESILDPRGVVRWEHRSRPDNKNKGDALALKGYKVRSWRVWGESGRAYHKQVNARRKALREEGVEEVFVHEPAIAEQAIKLEWMSPISKPRRYAFQYSGAMFYWEGTRDLCANEVWAKRLMPLNHLKLVAQVGGEKIFVAHYKSDFGSKKFGRLWVFDSAVEKIRDLCEEEEYDDDDDDVKNDRDGTEKGPEWPDVESTESDVRATRLYEIVMATAMCMIVGEWEKRLTVWLIIMLGGEAANSMNAGGGGA